MHRKLQSIAARFTAEELLALGVSESHKIRPPKFNIDPENPQKWWLEDNFPIWKVTFQGRTVKLQECKRVKGHNGVVKRHRFSQVYCDKYEFQYVLVS